MTSILGTRKYNIMDGAAVISLYASVADLTDRMLAAAYEENWYVLAQLEADCAHVVAMLKKNEGGVILTDDRREHKRRLLKKILEDDRHIRHLTDQGLTKLSALMQNARAERRLANAYGSNT